MAQYESCKPINLGAGRGFGPRDRAFMVVPPVAAAAATPNSLITTTFKRVPRIDELGRVGHLVGLLIRGTLQYDAVAATMPTAMPGQLQLTSLDNILLRAGGQSFFLGADGADFDDDMVMRNNKREAAPPADVADGDATNATVVVTWAYIFGRPLRGDGPGRALDGAIPLYLFDEQVDAGAQLQLRVASAPSSGGGQTAAFPGVTYDGFQSSDLRVIAIVRYDDDIADVMPWGYRVFPTTELVGQYDLGDFAEYLTVRDRVGTTNWTPSHDDYDGIRSFAGDTEILDGRTSLETAMIQNAITLQADDGPQAGSGPRMLTVTDPEYLPLICSPGGYRQADLGRGRTSWTFTARTDHTRTRVIGRGLGINPNQYRDKVLNHSPVKVVGKRPMTPNASPKAALMADAGIIPRMLITEKK